MFAATGMCMIFMCDDNVVGKAGLAEKITAPVRCLNGCLE